MAFQLSSSLIGHSLDVRCITVTNDNSILSGSRDKTAKLWKANIGSTSYTEIMTYKDQKNFVASILYIEPTRNFPDGLVVTGGNDNVILIYKPYELVSVYSLKEHAGTVCCLSKGNDSDTFLSSSWDNTAKLWSLTNFKISLTTFSGHQATVWSVIQLSDHIVVTASADKTIRMWLQNGQQFKILQGHTDCVRNLADFSDQNYFVSVANDATIKMWTYTGELIDTLHGHTTYIYGIARNRAGGVNCFVTSDEDRTVRYWVNGINTEIIQLPAQSVWSVNCLNNGDIVTGSSDGVVRIFTRDKSRVASEDALKAFEKDVTALSQQASQEIAGYKVSDLPGREALYEPGKRAGQLKMIRESCDVVAYTWVEDGNNSHWEKVGDVVGGTDKTSEGKTMFEGEAYDFVFNVDVEDGKPPLKLPYNIGDDPYVAANQFLTKYKLPMIYLDQVVDFILKNSNSEQPPMSSEYVDPFTGTSRYTPSSGSASVTRLTSNNLDPFTGASSYTTTPRAPTFFPQMDYRTFDMGDPQIILNKLKEFNQKFGDSGSKVDESTLQDVIKLCKQRSPTSECMNALFLMLDWPDDLVFPVLDIVRLALKNEHNNFIISARNNGGIIHKLAAFVGPNCNLPDNTSVSLRSPFNCNLPNNTLVSLRALCNFFCHKPGEELIYQHRNELLENIVGISAQNKNIEIALATYLLNAAILSHRYNDEVSVLLLASVIPDTIVNLNDPEAQFRALIGLGTLFSLGENELQAQVKMKVLEQEMFIQKIGMLMKESSHKIEAKRTACAQQIQNALYN